MQPATGAASDSVTGLASRERVRAFDLARGLAVLFMIGVHVLWHWGSPDTWSSPAGTAISFLGGPTAAPTFMFLMGASLAFSTRSSFGSLLARGIWLVFLGYLLNVLRGVIPATLGMAAGAVTQEQILPFTPWWLLTSVDIHHMAGLSLIVLAAFRLRWRPGWPWLAAAVGLALVGPWVRGMSFGTPLLDGPLTPVLGGAPNVYYAVVPWLAYPLAGAVFGRLVAEAGSASPAGPGAVVARRRIFRLGGLLGLALCAAGALLLALTRPDFDVATYWREPPAYIVGIFGLVLVWLAVCDAVTRIGWIERRLGLVYRWSAQVIPMYFTHWLVVGWGIGVVGFRDLALGPVLVTIPIAVAATHLLSRFSIALETPVWLDRWFSGRPVVPVVAEPAPADR
jgi:uncharacterized membrane protein